MTRLQNTRTGAVVSCKEATAARLGSEWGPVQSRKSGKRQQSAKTEKTETTEADASDGDQGD